jgi:hypothetical protein
MKETLKKKAKETHPKKAKNVNVVNRSSTKDKKATSEVLPDDIQGIFGDDNSLSLFE